MTSVTEFHEYGQSNNTDDFAIFTEKDHKNLQQRAPSGSNKLKRKENGLR